MRASCFLAALALLTLLRPISAASPDDTTEPPPWAPFAVQGQPFSQAQPVNPSSERAFTRVAFIADLDLRSSGAGRLVLQLVKREAPDATIFSGDLDYLQLGQDAPNRIGQRRTYPTVCVATLDAELGRDHPIFVAMGNHEGDSGVSFRAQAAFPDEPTYAQLLLKRMERLRLNDSCTGFFGGDLACSFNGLLIVGSGIAVADEPAHLAQRRREHEQFMQSSLDRFSQARWRICHWHAPASEFNTGALPRGPEDNPGLKMYELCIQRGAVIATGHDHSMERSKAVKSISAAGRIEVHGAPYWHAATSTRKELLVLDAGSGLVFVNGLGGLDLRGTFQGKGRNAWWSKLVNADATGGWRGSSARDSGALFCDFGCTQPGLSFDAFVALYSLPPEIVSKVDDYTKQSALCFFKNAENKLLDEFLLLNLNELPAAPTVPAGPAVASTVADAPAVDASAGDDPEVFLLGPEIASTVVVHPPLLVLVVFGACILVAGFLLVWSGRKCLRRSKHEDPVLHSQ